MKANNFQRFYLLQHNFFHIDNIIMKVPYFIYYNFLGHILSAYLYFLHE